MKNEKLLKLYLVIAIGIFLWSGTDPYERLTWWLEVLPVLIGAPLLFLTYKNFPLTSLLYLLIFLHALLLMVGAHYTYTHVPLGEWLKQIFDLKRNNYDRLGHFFQGFVPAILAREILIRRTSLRPGGWLFFIVTSICLAFSAAFELFEWSMAMLLGSDADEYLATQGDQWDTQWDMFLCLIGAMISQLLLSKHHNRLINKLRGS